MGRGLDLKGGAKGRDGGLQVVGGGVQPGQCRQRHTQIDLRDRPDIGVGFARVFGQKGAKQHDNIAAPGT